MIDRYLARLGLVRRPPSVDYLFALHRAHVSKVPYTNVEVLRGTSAPIQPMACVAQIVSGKGGYCFHLNGAFSWLLRELGFAVTLHRGFVRNRGNEAELALNHLALVVHDLDGVWFVDAGLGDALYEPLPLTPGTYDQGPFRYQLSAGDRWLFTHDERGSFQSMEFEPAAARFEDFADAHHRLSTSPDSSFLKFLTAQIRLADRVPMVRCCTFAEVDASGRSETTLDSLEQWSAALAGIGVGGCEDLWPAEREAHQAWLATL